MSGDASLEHTSGMVQQPQTSIKTTLTFTTKLALDDVHRYLLGKDLLLELGSGEQVNRID